jgi:galactokinase
MDSEYASRRGQCEEAARLLGVRALRDITLSQLGAARLRLSDAVYRRARHVVSENERTLHAARAIQASDWTVLGNLMYESHASLRDDYEGAAASLTRWLRSAGSWGLQVADRMDDRCRFGGCAVCLARTGSVQLITQPVKREHRINNQAGMFSSPATMHG